MNTFVPNPNLEMLMQREQLMEDIDAIVDDFYTGPVDENGRPIGIKVVNKDELVAKLCDAVCRNFPC